METLKTQADASRHKSNPYTPLILSLKIRYKPPLKALIMDDAGIQRSVNKLCVGEAFTGSDITEAHDGAEGFEFYLGSEWGLIITDMQMGQPDDIYGGEKFIRLIRRIGDPVPIIIMTALVRNKSVLKLVEEFDNILYIEKPIRPMQFATDLTAMAEIIV